MNDIVREIISVALDCAPELITEDARLGTYPKWDSLAQLRLMLELQRRFDIPIDATTIRKFNSFRELAKFADDRKKLPRT